MCRKITTEKKWLRQIVVCSTIASKTVTEYCLSIPPPLPLFILQLITCQYNSNSKHFSFFLHQHLHRLSATRAAFWTNPGVYTWSFHCRTSVIHFVTYSVVWWFCFLSNRCWEWQVKSWFPRGHVSAPWWEKSTLTKPCWQALTESTFGGWVRGIRICLLACETRQLSCQNPSHPASPAGAAAMAAVVAQAESCGQNLTSWRYVQLSLSLLDFTKRFPKEHAVFASVLCMGLWGHITRTAVWFLWRSVSLLSAPPSAAVSLPVNTPSTCPRSTRLTNSHTD